MMSQEYETYMAALLAGNRHESCNIAKRVLQDGMPIEEFYEAFIQSSMSQIGDMWERDQISVATEHIASSITERVLIEVYPNVYNASSDSKTALIACTNGEYHQIGARIVADYMEINGWNTIFMGSNTPVDSILDKTTELQPDFLGLSITRFQNISLALETLDLAAEKWPNMICMLGGQAISNCPPEFRTAIKPYAGNLEQLKKLS